MERSSLSFTLFLDIYCCKENTEMNLLRISLSILGLVISFSMTAQLSFTVPKNNPVELGKVNWLRNYDEALAKSEEKGLPVFIQFQEVPGCATCSTYGNMVLSHPFIVEAIETHFIPLVIYNNKGGEDAKILKRYKEPSWNNPVARIVNEQGKDLVSRLSGNYSKASVINLIINGMVKSNQLAPGYLRLFQEELNLAEAESKELTLSMYCFWTGEKEIGKIPGVFKTAAGFMNGNEVVQVAYDPNLVSEKQLITEANKSRCADQVFTDDKSISKTAKKIVGKDNVAKTSGLRLDKDQKYYLKKSKFAHIPMTEHQSMKANSLIGSGQSPIDILSPRQLQLATQKENRMANNKSSFEEKWYSIVGRE